MRKQAKKFLTLLTLFLVVLFAISCNKDNAESKGLVGRIKGIISIFKIKKDKGIERYAGNWSLAQSDIPIPEFKINPDGSITLNPFYDDEVELIEDISKINNKNYSFVDSKGNIINIEFENNTLCNRTIIPYDGEMEYTETLIKQD